MISCVYTAQKTKKTKTWKEGFIKSNGNYISLFDYEKNCIYEGRIPFIAEEMETFKYLIYVEDPNFLTQNDKTELKKNSSQENINKKCDESIFKRKKISTKKKDYIKEEATVEKIFLNQEQVNDDSSDNLKLNIETVDELKPNDDDEIAKGRTNDEVLNLFK